MQTPARSTIRGRTLLIYALVWLIIAIIHTIVLLQHGQFPAGIAITEALLFNGWFAVLGTGVWYMARFSDLRKRSTAELIFTHISGVSAIVLLWLLPTYPLQQALFGHEAGYTDFLSSSLIMRVVLGIIYYAILTSLTYLVFNIRELKDQQIRESELKSLLRESELNMLRFQINPHFLFNSLNAVNALIITRPEEASAMVVKLSEFMRYSLDSSGKVMSTLGDEIRHCNQYLEIEQVRFGERLRVEKEVDESLLSIPVPAMLLQPLIENSIKHGLDAAEHGITLFLGAARTTTGIRIEVSNPYDSSGIYQRPGTGTGLKNIRARLQNLYGTGHLLETSQTDGVFRVKIDIPVV